MIQGKNMIYVLKRTLDLVDPRLISHGERVAYLVHDMLRMQGQPSETIIEVCLAALLHDIGAYKMEEIDRLVEFETKHVSDHAVYGYLFLKMWLPNQELAKLVLFHHLPYQVLDKLSLNTISRFANMILLADRLDIYLRIHGEDSDVTKAFQNQNLIDPALIALFHEANDNYHSLANLKNGSFHAVMDNLVEHFELAKKDVYSYLQLIAYSIDFRSEQTVSHTILVVELATQLAARMNLSDEMVEKIRLGALLHDLGKIATPISVLEKPAALTKEETIVMKQHVVMTRNILEGYIDDEVCKIAYRHHERLNGKGYPEGLKEADLSIPEMIMAVADIASALLGKRSYKDPYPKSEVIRILKNLVKNNDIHAGVVEVLIANYEDICTSAYTNSQLLVDQYNNLRFEFASTHEWYESIISNKTC